MGNNLETYLYALIWEGDNVAIEIEIKQIDDIKGLEGKKLDNIEYIDEIIRYLTAMKIKLSKTPEQLETLRIIKDVERIRRDDLDYKRI